MRCPIFFLYPPQNVHHLSSSSQTSISTSAIMVGKQTWNRIHRDESCLVEPNSPRTNHGTNLVAATFPPKCQVRARSRSKRIKHAAGRDGLVHCSPVCRDSLPTGAEPLEGSVTRTGAASPRQTDGLVHIYEIKRPGTYVHPLYHQFYPRGPLSHGSTTPHGL